MRWWVRVTSIGILMPIAAACSEPNRKFDNDGRVVDGSAADATADSSAPSRPVGGSIDGADVDRGPASSLAEGTVSLESGPAQGAPDSSGNTGAGSNLDQSNVDGAVGDAPTPMPGAVAVGADAAGTDAPGMNAVGLDAATADASSGVDAGPCGTGRKLCGGSCVSTDDPQYGCAAEDCIACAAVPNGVPACVGGACGAACSAGWGDCTADPGCETSLRRSPNCGGCNRACGRLVCGWESMHCYDPRWADWPMPNSWASAAAPGGGVTALPNQRSYDASSIPGVVRDDVTRLQWQQVVPVSTSAGTGRYTFDEANLYCANLDLAGGKGAWRVPTRIELLSLVDTSVDTSAGAATINASAFPNAPADWFWTSSIVAGNTSLAWEVLFTNGYANNGDPVTTQNLVRCVR